MPNQLSEQGIGKIQDGKQLTSQVNVWGTALYAQDQWTRGKLTLQGGVRYDHTWTSYPDLSVGGTRIIPQVISFPSGSTQSVHWDDITPRMGVAYDLFGNGKTAVKFNLGKYAEALSSIDGNALNPLQRIATTTTRSWNDRGGLGINGDYVPQCDLANPDANGECGAMANRNLGTNTITRTWDETTSTAGGSGPTTGSWRRRCNSSSSRACRCPSATSGAGSAIGIRRRTGRSVSRITRRSTSRRRSIPAAGRRRLPGGPDIRCRAVEGRVVDQYSTWSSNFAEQTEHWNGFDINITARQGRLTAQGGTSTGAQVRGQLCASGGDAGVGIRCGRLTRPPCRPSSTGPRRRVRGATTRSRS